MKNDILYFDIFVIKKINMKKRRVYFKKKLPCLCTDNKTLKSNEPNKLDRCCLSTGKSNGPGSTGPGWSLLYLAGPGIGLNQLCFS